jgi:Tol biopolymer transport system component
MTLGRVTALFALAAALVVSAAAAERQEEPQGKVVFVRAQPGIRFPYTVMEIDLASGRERVVARLPLSLVPASWSPDFRRLALVTVCVGGSGNGCHTIGPLYIFNVVTGRLRRVLHVNAAVAKWSPDGRLIGVAGDLRQRSGVFLVDPAGRKRPRLIVRGGRAISLSWSPDGSKIMYGWIDGQVPYTCCGLILAVDRQGRHRQEVTAGTTQGVESIWAPDGRHVAFTAAIGPSGVWIVDLGGGGTRVLTQTPDRVVSWSPDGSTIALKRLLRDGGQQLVLVDVYRTGEQPIAANGAYAAWSPNSQAVVYTNTDTEGTHLYLANRDGSSVRQLTDGPVSDTWPHWVTSEAAPRR